MSHPINTPEEFQTRCRAQLRFLVSEFGFAEVSPSDQLELGLAPELFSLVIARSGLWYEFRGTGWGMSATASVGARSDGKNQPEFFHMRAAADAAVGLGFLQCNELPDQPRIADQESWIIYLAEFARRLTPILLSSPEPVFEELRRQRAHDWNRWLDKHYNTHRETIRLWPENPYVVEWLKKDGKEMNAINLIIPYQYEGMWVFDDPRAGLDKEPFVSGADTMIDVLVKDIPNAGKGFRLLFSSSPFPGYTAKLEWRREEYGGNWYFSPDFNIEGWLCPALFKYFETAPREIYVRAEPRNQQ